MSRSTSALTLRSAADPGSSLRQSMIVIGRWSAKKQSAEIISRSLLARLDPSSP